MSGAMKKSFEEIMASMGVDWTVRDLAEELGVHRVNAQRRIIEWLLLGKVAKVGSEKHGHGRVARYRAVGGVSR